MINSKKIIAFLLCLCMSFTAVYTGVFADDTEYATREYIVSEFVQSIGRGQLEKSEAVLAMFSDSDDISEEYREDISRAIVAGYLKGYDDHTIKPTEPVKRVEAMAILARCMPELEEVCEEIEFTDVPEWAEENIAYLSRTGLVKGYGDGRMGADDLITVEHVGLLVERCDKALSVVNPGDSFFGYVNEKTFRNAVLENTTQIDPIHGAVVTTQNSWSHFNDVYNEIVEEENEILEMLVNDELPREKGSVEQRIYDMLECIDSDIVYSESDKTNITNMREAILESENTEELLDVAGEIYKLAGINVLFDINIYPDKETGIVYPSFTAAAIGDAGLLAFRKDTATPEYMTIYADLISEYLDIVGAEFSEDEIADALDLQIQSSKDVNYIQTIATYLAFAQLFGIIDNDGMLEIMDEITKAHPEMYDAETESLIPAETGLFETKDREEADKTFNGYDLCEELASYGFTNLEKIIVPIESIAAAEKDIISDENLDALKINAILKLNSTLGVNLSEEENKASERLNSFAMLVYLTGSAEDLSAAYNAEPTEEDIENVETSTGLELDEGLLKAGNISSLSRLLPIDIALLYCKYYYDEEINDDMSKMFDDIWNAYEARFKANTWMSEETKANAIKKLDNMIAIIAYPDNYTYPEITPISEGGTLFSNTLSIQRNNLADLIRSNEDKEFIRTTMVLSPDDVNACYIPVLNIINVPAGILNAPIYDKDASYAEKLGSIGMIIAHEIGHAFDKSGALYDENGCENNWWTESDYAEFTKIQDEFTEYYNKFEVTDGVVQDSTITITENMADFAAMQIIMDIIGDDQQAQKECFESYAKLWASLGTVAYLTDSYLLNDVHSANGVRVNAVVASFQQFYDIYGIEEGDAMYIAPEDRLRLW